MPKQPQADVTDAELAVLKALWDSRAAPIRQLTDVLYEKTGPSEYATVQKLLERLEQKGYVKRKPAGRVNVFSPAVERSDLIALRLRDTALKLCEGSMAPLLTHLVGNSRLSDGQIAELRELVDALDDAPSTRGRSKEGRR